MSLDDEETEEEEEEDEDEDDEIDGEPDWTSETDQAGLGFDDWLFETDDDWLADWIGLDEETTEEEEEDDEGDWLNCELPEADEPTDDGTDDDCGLTMVGTT